MEEFRWIIKLQDRRSLVKLGQALFKEAIGQAGTGTLQRGKQKAQIQRSFKGAVFIFKFV